MKLTQLLANQILVFLLKYSDVITKEKTQQILLKVLETLDKGTSDVSIDKDQLLVSSEGLDLYRVADYLYTAKRNWGKVITCRLKDPYFHVR